MDSVLSACSSFIYIRNTNVSPTDPRNYPCGTKVKSIFMLGTSMAAAHVSGIAALAASAAGSMKPTQIVEILRRSADHLGQPGRNAQYGFGRVNAYRAVMYATQAAARPSELGDDQQEAAHP
jgi:subtilisin family serine protease